MRMTTLLLVAALLVVAWLAARCPEDTPGMHALERALGGRLLPVAAFMAAFVVTAYVWGSPRPLAVFHDEAAYLLQAELFARFRWTLPTPVVSRAFEQAAVLVTPALAPKMGPGHALALVPGVWLGVPALMPLLLTGTAAALLVLLARRAAGAPAALLTLILWLTASGNMRWRPTFFSETSSTVAMLGAWWCLLEWRATRKSRWLLILAALAGWGAVTRPLTLLAFAMPVGLIVIADVARGGWWRQLGTAMAVGTACLLIVPLQAWRVTGSAGTTPLALYTRQYVPSDVIGFGFVRTAPERALPPDLSNAFSEFDTLHLAHTPTSLPATFVARVSAVLDDQYGGWRSNLAPFAIVGVLAGPPAVAFALATALSVMLAYLGYAHQPYWTVYYLELLTVLSFVTAVGLGHSLAWLAARIRGSALSPAAGPVMAVLALLVSLQPMVQETQAGRVRIERLTWYQRRYAEAFSQLPESHLLVFVKYGPHHPRHFSLIRNVADPARARLVTAYDLGPAVNDSVVRAFPDRAVYVLDEGRRALQRIILPR